jgi:hypothetical protein
MKTQIINNGNGTAKEITTVNYNEGINASNFLFLQFYGSANGSNLTRNYNIQSIQQNYLRIIALYIDYYTTSATWYREACYDNNSFTTNVNSRYSLLRSTSKLDPLFLHTLSSTNQFIKLFIENQLLNIFPPSYQPAFNKIDLNILPNILIAQGIDIAITSLFYNNVDTPTTLNPFVVVTMPVEILPLTTNNQANSYNV